MIFVLLFVTLSYLEVVKVYTKAGGAYVVARENFGLNVAQVAAMSLLIDYTLDRGGARWRPVWLPSPRSSRA